MTYKESCSGKRPVPEGNPLCSGKNTSGRMSANGFTLVEVVMALSLSTLVVLTLALSFSLVLGLWEKEQKQEADEISRVMNLLHMQSAALYPGEVKVEGKPVHSFRGTDRELTLITTGSVKSLHGGAPVAVRYEFDGLERELRYTERSLTAAQDTLAKMFQSGSSSLRADFTINVHEVSFAYVPAGGDSPVDSWSGETKELQGVVVTYFGAEGEEPVQLMVSPGLMQALPGSADEKS